MSDLSDTFRPLHDLTRQIGHRVCPLYRDDKNGRHQLVGTGTLFLNTRTAFILTASHVANEFVDAPLILPARDNFFQVATELNAFEYISSPQVDPDVTAIRISWAVALKLREYYLFTLDDEVVETGPLSDFTWYIIVGYPATKNQPVSRNDIVNISTCYVMGRSLIDVTQLKLPGKKAETHLALSAPPDCYFSGATLERQTMFKLHGMSGAGVWRVDICEQTGRIRSPRLVGIAIEQHIKSKHVIVATRAHVALSLMSRADSNDGPDNASNTGPL